MKEAFRALALTGTLVAAGGGTARADVVLSGPDANDGSYSSAALQAFAGANTVNSGGLTGISLWAFLGGANAANNTSPFYGAITTSTAPGMNAKNSILRYYLVATNATGQQSVVSMGEVSPQFGGTAPVPAFVAFKNTSGGLLAEPALVVPGAAGRGLSDLTSLSLLSVPAISGTGGASTSLQLTGNVSNPGTCTTLDLQNDFTPVVETTSNPTATYTGVGLWAFLNPTHPGSTNQIVVAQAKDGYEVVYAQAEIDPSLGGNPGDLLPYAGTGFPDVGVARTVFPTDNAHGRWQSNLTSLAVVEAPEPASMTLFGMALTALGTMRRRAFRRSAAARPA